SARATTRTRTTDRHPGESRGRKPRACRLRPEVPASAGTTGGGNKGACDFEVPPIKGGPHAPPRARTGMERGRSSAGRALQWHCRGQGFDPPRLHHSNEFEVKAPRIPRNRVPNRTLADEVSSAGAFGFWSRRGPCSTRCPIA